MSYPDHRIFDIPDTVVIGESDVIEMSQATQKGYTIVRDVGAAFVGNLEGSVLGDVWTVIIGLAATGQGSVAAHYNFFRLKYSTGGAKGATTRIGVGGKIIR